MKISICIPIYNVAPFIEQCARSLFEQTYEDMEYVFVDDCSPDDSVAILRRVMADYPARMPRIKIVSHAQNKGLIAARQTALAAATGDVVAHCDSDDWVDRDFYENAIRAFDAPAVDLVYVQCCREYSDGTHCDPPLMGYNGTGAGYFARAREEPGFNSACNKIVRSHLAKDADIEFPAGVGTGEDLCYTAQILAKCREVRFAAKARFGYHYRQNPSSMTRAFVHEKVYDDLTRVHDVIVRKIPMHLTGPIRLKLTESILYYGARSGRWRMRDFRVWRERHRSAGGKYEFVWLNKWGRLYMKLAALSLGLANVYARVMNGRIGNS